MWKRIFNLYSIATSSGPQTEPQRKLDQMPLVTYRCAEDANPETMRGLFIVSERFRDGMTENGGILRSVWLCTGMRDASGVVAVLPCVFTRVVEVVFAVVALVVDVVIAVVVYSVVY